MTFWHIRPLDFHGMPLITIDFHWFPWISIDPLMAFNSMAFHGFIGFPWVFINCWLSLSIDADGLGLVPMDVAWFSLELDRYPRPPHWFRWTRACNFPFLARLWLCIYFASNSIESRSEYNDILWCCIWGSFAYPWMFLWCCFDLLSTFTRCSLDARWMFDRCSIDARYMFHWC